MANIKKVFFFPDAAKDNVRAEIGDFRGRLNYVAVLGTERTTPPYLDAPLDSQIAARLIQTLSPSAAEYVVLVKDHRPPNRLLEYLRQRNMAVASKQETRTYPSSMIYLAALGKKVRSTQHYAIFRTAALDDVRWTIHHYGSLDRVRVFVAKPEVASQIAAALVRPAAEIDYLALLELCEYHMLFDDDWEYFFVMTCKPFASHMVSWLRRACHELGLETDTKTNAKAMVNLRGRLERLIGVGLFHPVVPNSVTA